MSKMFAIALLASASASFISAAQASVASPKTDIGAAQDIFAGWGCVYIPGAGTFCGEDGNDKIPDEK